MVELTPLNAIINLCTVGLTTVGLIAVLRMLAAMDRESFGLGLFGAILVIIGGGGVAAGRLLVAYGAEPPWWMPENLFNFLFPGFSCLAYALWSAQRARAEERPARLWLQAALLLAVLQALAAYLVGMTSGPGMFVVLLTATTVASLIFNGLCMRQALLDGHRRTALIFGAHVGLVLALNGAAHSEGGIFGSVGSVQLLNIVSYALFALGAWQLDVITRRRAAARQALRHAELIP